MVTPVGRLVYDSEPLPGSPEQVVRQGCGKRPGRLLISPEMVRSVILCPDGDEPGRAAAQAAAERFRGEGRSVRVADPGAGRDFNDHLRGAA